ncbi:copper homeostasis protein CutC [Polaribacter gangjinensis]|uniref:PF03932 family protein CutC n=1 Tax=Polaribacter gangjinensis TaxID=574710 RepID=A0A2S7WAM4_9FLAO|nr:copper homeostasis protein CutC [Polaribacter gangjinensis]PQJ74680.1 copper homeostasis protein CutC [Polaribacter gangjinensis]
MILEICANSYESAINAQIAGAHRIEICSELSVGGITPSVGLLEKISKEISIPVHVLIRPRSGNFCYSNSEFEQMKTDILLCKKLGFQGIVSGVLTKNHEIDIEKTKQLISLSKPLKFTFHRAFDVVVNPKKTVQILQDLGVDRILTSGTKEKASDGIDLLIELKKITENKLIILPGSGINKDNVTLFKNAGFEEIHTSASKIITDKKSIFFDKTTQTVSDIETIKTILKSINNA